MQHTASGQGILRRCAAMQEYNNPASQGAANTFATLNDFIWQPVAGQLAGMKAANPACDFGPYAKGIMFQGTTGGNGLPTDFPEDWYTHDTAPFAKANRVNSTFGTTIWIMNPESASSWTDTSGEAGIVGHVYNGFSDFHKHWLVNRIKANAAYTNTFADSMGTQSLNHQLDPTSHNAESQTSWFGKLQTFMATVQAYIHSQGFEVDPNGLVTNAGTYNYGDGAMLENAFRQPTDPSLATFSSTTLQSKLVTHGQRLIDTQLAGKNAFPLTQILTGSAGITHGSAAEQAWREYTAACYYLFDLGSLYIDFNCFADSATDHGNAFNRNLSTPMDAVAIDAPADLQLATGTSGNLYGRRFVRGFVLVNTSSASISYTLPRSDYKKIDGTSQSASISVPARTGIVLYATTDDPAAGGGPPPPPPPPPPSTFFDMDFGVNTPTATPFGFDSLPNGVGAGATMEVVTGTGTVGTPLQSGAGIRTTVMSNAAYVTEKTNGVTKPGYIGVVLQWYKIQPTIWNAYDTTAFSGFDTLIDYAAAEAAAGRPVKIGLRILAGADAPVGGRDTDGSTVPSWMVGGPSASNNNKATDYMIWASNDGGARLSHVPIFWNSDFSYNDAYLYHYGNLMSFINTYLSQTTAGGNRRGDYVLHVPVAAPTEVGSEMPLAMGTGTASFNPPVTIAGTTYGNDTNGAPSIANIGTVNRASSKLHMPASVAADTQNAQDTWLANWYHNMSTAVVGGSIAPGDGAWMRAIAIHMAQANFSSSIAYGMIFSDAYVRAKDILTRSVGYLKTKLWTGQTNGRVWPPGGDFGQPVSTWTYRNWSGPAADIFDLALSLVAPAYPLIWIQTANSVGYGGARGMPESDFIQTATDFMNTYKAQFLETYASVWSDATYKAANVAFTNGTLIPQLAANAQAAASGGAARGELHIKEVSTLSTGPVGRRLIPAGNSDVWYRFVLDDLTTPSVISTMLLSQPSGGSNNGDLALRMSATKQIVVRWNSSSGADWTDTVPLVKGDCVEIRHLLNGATSGYEVWVNNSLRHSNYTLAAPAASTVSFVNLGFPNAANVEAWFYRFAAATVRLGPPGSLTSPTNSDTPVVTISNPANGTVYTSAQSVQVSASASDLDGISKMEAQLDGGAWQQMTLQGSAYVVTLNLTGVAGTAQAHVIAVRATDGFADTTKRNIGTASVTVTVNIPGVDTTKPVINVTSPSSASTVVGNGVATQIISGTVTDNVGVTSFTINGIPVTVGGGGVFTTTLPLIVGSNVFTLIAKDAAGNTQTLTYTVQRQDVVVNVPPALSVTSPVDGAVFPADTSQVTLVGTVSDSDGTIASLTYSVDNSFPVPLTFSAGIFSRAIPLTQGQHQVTIVATDNTGLTASATINISIASSTPPGDGAGTGFNIALDFGKGTVVVRV